MLLGTYSQACSSWHSPFGYCHKGLSKLYEGILFIKHSISHRLHTCWYYISQQTKMLIWELLWCINWIHQPSRRSNLESRGFGDNLRTSSPQVEIFRLSARNRTWDPTEAASDFTIQPILHFTTNSAAACTQPLLNKGGFGIICCI